ncbi:hypothetical protein [Pontibacter pamirensis]|uniref:hypothetical protein n=1 Tax=Pontibacter pamirensis TaxID=2562824 RepID=UPI0013896519|nr:hypothetical protein [Pontibacter pamirensis]
MTDKNVETFPVDPLNQSLPAYGLIYFKHLLGQYETLPEDKLTRPEAVKMNKILVEYHKAPQNISWKDLYVFDMLLVKILPPEKLRRKVWNLRARYREVAGIREYDAYLASKPPELVSEVDVGKSDDIVRADIDFLMSEIYVRYAMEPIRQLERKVLSKRLAFISIIGIGIIFIFSFFAYLNERYCNGNAEATFPGSVFFVAMFSGVMGGLISMLQRFQSLTNDGDPINNVSQMTYGQFGVSISAITGAISAVVLFMVFEAGLLSGELFPSHAVPSEDDKDSSSFLNFYTHVGPNSIGGFAKLIVWCFIAGFAERFVPDTLSRFVSKRQTERETGS